MIAGGPGAHPRAGGTAALQSALAWRMQPVGRSMALAHWRTRREPANVGAVSETDIPARLDRLPWGRFHTLVVVALGITWILDGLEVTLAGSVAGALRQSPVLQFSATDIGFAASARSEERRVGKGGRYRGARRS